MRISSIFWRPVNLLRSRNIRAQSHHTSDWGLKRIFLTGNDVTSQLAAREMSTRHHISYFAQEISESSLWKLCLANEDWQAPLTKLQLLAMLGNKNTVKIGEDSYTETAQGYDEAMQFLQAQSSGFPGSPPKRHTTYDVIYYPRRAFAKHRLMKIKHRLSPSEMTKLESVTLKDLDETSVHEDATFSDWN